MSSHRFDRAAATYDAYAGIQREMADWLAEWIPEDRRGDAIEIGAGTGLFTAHLLPWRGRLQATDLSPNMVAAGRKHYPDAAWSVRDAEASGASGEEPLDWIFSCSFLQWSEEPERLLRAWRKQLAPRGRVLAGFFVEGAVPELHRILGPRAPLRYRTADEWRNLFQRAGYRVLNTGTRAESRRYPSALDLFRHLHRIGATGRPALSFSQIRTLLDTCDETCRHPEGGVRANWKYCRILAEGGEELLVNRYRLSV